MDFQFWVWLIIVVATLVSRALKKTAKTPNPPSNQPYTGTDTSEHKPMSFEELLKEIQASKTPALPVEKTQSKQIDYDDDLEEEEKNYEKILTKSEDRSYEIYERAKQEAFYRPSLEETMKLEDTIVKYDHFKGYEESSKNELANGVLNDFKDPDGFRKAFIMSEILKRKF